MSLYQCICSLNLGYEQIILNFHGNIHLIFASPFSILIKAEITLEKKYEYH